MTAGLGRRVGQPGVDDQAGNRRRIDDLAAAVCEHVAARGLTTQKDAAQVHVEFRLPVGFGHVLGLAELENARVVEGEVQAAQFVQRGPDQRLDLIFPGNVNARRNRAPACGDDFVRGPACGLLIDVRNDDRGAGFGQPLRNRAAESRTAAGHVATPPRQIEQPMSAHTQCRRSPASSPRRLRVCLAGSADGNKRGRPEP